DVGTAKDRTDHVLETVFVLLGVPPRPQRPPLLGQELSRNPGALVGTDFHPLPRLVAGPRIVEPTLPAERRRERGRPTAADSQHRPHAVVQRIRYPRGLVDDEKAHP